MRVIGIAYLMVLLSARIGNCAGDGIPKLNVRPSCEAAAAGSVIAGRDTKACLDDERGAQDQITQNWSKYSPTDKAQCVGMVNTGGPPSYVELLACLDIMKDSTEIHKSELTDPLLENGKMDVRKLQPSYFDAISPKTGSAVETSSAANHRSARTARRAPTAHNNWCLYYHAGGVNCGFSDFQGCMYAASALRGNCQLSPSWRARYGDRLPRLEQWRYGGAPDYCFDITDLQCY
jgi:hypothetical protein